MSNPLVVAHFLSAGEIWIAYFEKKISRRVRDQLLDELRAALRRDVPLPQ